LRVFVDAGFFQAENAAYAFRAIRAALSEAGYALASTRAEADSVFELRAGAPSLEQMCPVFGLPEVRVPINDSFNIVSSSGIVDLQPPRPGRRRRVFRFSL